MTLDEGIQSDIARISRVIEDLDRAGREPGFNQVLALAQLLAQFYTGLESCFEKKLRLAKIPLPHKSAQYHRDIFALAIKSNLIPKEQVDFLDDLLSFRHFARHAYGAELQADIVRDKVANAEKAWVNLKPILQAPSHGAK